MGNCQPQSIETQINREIEHDIEKDKSLEVRKLLLLGAGECGKSTILKQLRLLHDAFNENEMLFYKPLIFSHIITSMVTLAEEMNVFEIHFENPEREIDIDLVKNIILKEQDQHPITPELRNAIKLLWKDGGIKSCYEHKDEIHVNDSAKYFFDEIERIAKSDYEPTNQDILNVRSATLGVQEVRFWNKNTKFRIFDVGGQKSQRKKWIHVFDDVNAVIFITAISEFNQMMKEDTNTNRLLDSLTLFSEVSNGQYFTKTAMILFLNKKDIFQEKINQKLSLKSAFSDYYGQDDYENSTKFIRMKFKDVVVDQTKQVYIHETCANDTNQVQVVLQSVTAIVISQNMDESGV